MNASDTPEHIVGYGNFGNDELVFEVPFVALYEKIWELISNAIDQDSIDRDEDFSDPDNSLGMDLSSRGWVEMLLECGVEIDIREFDAEGPGLSDTFFDIIARDDQERNNLKDSLTGIHDEIRERIDAITPSPDSSTPS